MPKEKATYGDFAREMSQAQSLESRHEIYKQFSKKGIQLLNFIDKLNNKSLLKEAFQYFVDGGLQINSFFDRPVAHDDRYALVSQLMAEEKLSTYTEDVSNFLIEEMHQGCYFDQQDIIITLMNKSPDISRQLIETAINTQNALFLNMIKEKLEPDYIRQLIQEGDVLSTFTELTSFKAPKAITQHLARFDDVEDLEYEQALIVAAEVFQRKNTQYKAKGTDADLVVLKNHEEMMTLISSLGKTPGMHRFIMTGQHWICGEITFNTKGEVSIVICDSKGGKDPYPNTVELIDYLKEQIPNSEIYLNIIQTQKDWISCKTFALDNARKMMQFSMNDRGGKSFSEYVKEAAVTQEAPFSHPSNDDDSGYDESADSAPASPLHATVKMYSEPASMLLSTQSVSQQTQWLQDENFSTQSVDKKGRTFSEKYKEHHRVDEDSEKVINSRVLYKQQTISEHCKHFLRTHDDKTIEIGVDRHSLQGYLKRKSQASLKNQLHSLRDQPSEPSNSVTYTVTRS